MKKILLLLIISFITQINAQTINDTPFKELDVEYLEIVGNSKIFSSKISIKLDIGQFSKLISSNDEMKVKDANGQRLDFNSMIDALNFVSANGYEFVTAYVVTTSDFTTYHYLMRKRK